MYDYMDLPDNVNKLEKINDQIDAVQNDLYRMYNSMEEIVENVKKLKEINETSGDN
jgi:hypothetical protein